MLKRRMRGMTLIELLISLSIIAMMVGIAIPLFSSSQNRNSINSDAQAIAQMFSYAAALQNNPDSFSRNHPDANASRVSLKVVTSKVGVEKFRTLLIYSTTQPDNVFDRLVLGSKENLKLNGILLNDDEELVISISGKSPQENINCAPSRFDCKNSLKIDVISTRDVEISKSVIVKNTVLTDPLNPQYFSVIYGQ